MESLATYQPTGKTIVIPQASTISLVLKARKAITHHDPAQSDGSNTRQFRRRPKLIKTDELALDNVESAISAVYAHNPVPASLAEMLTGFSATEFIAVAFTSVFVDSTNTGEGLGHFGNADKFPALQKRLKQAAVKTFDLRHCWSALCELMGVNDTADSKLLPRLMPFFGLPRPVAYAVLGELAKNSNAYVSIAQYWHDQWKLATRSIEYAEKRGEDIGEMMTLEPKIDFSAGTIIRLDIPEVSETSIRHQLRSAGREHLFAAIGMVKGQVPGWGEIQNDLIEALFYNGGNKTNASPPSDAPTRGALIQMNYPLLGVFSGTTESQFLPEGKLRVKNWVICRENAEALANTPVADHPLLQVSVFDMLGEETETRRATERGYGQMIQNFETLIENAEIYLEFDLDFHATDLERGAFMAALETWLADAPVLGGQRARGRGFVDGQIVQGLDGAEADLAAYEAYVCDNAQTLKAGLIDGTMLIGKEVV